MRAFCGLFERLDRAGGTAARVSLLQQHFAAADPADAAWALHCLLGKQRRRLITGRRLRQICLAQLQLPDWLFEACYSQVGDSAETIALLLHGEADPALQRQESFPSQADGCADLQGATGPASPCGAPPAARPVADGGTDNRDEDAPAADVPAADAPDAEDRSAGIQERDTPPEAAAPLHVWMEQRLPAAAALQGEEQALAVQALWRGLDARELLVVNKLLTGGFRVGVGPGLVIRALAGLSGLEESELAHRLMGGFTPSAQAYRALLAAGSSEAVPSRPYPFFLASPLEPTQLEQLREDDPTAWQVEWKWDGIRGQLIHRAGEAFLWSRGEELLNEGFPELIALARQLPAGTVLDGEILVWPQQAERPAPFASLQRRLGRRSPGARLLQECPACFVAYDLLESDGLERRGEPLGQRRRRLQDLLRSLPHDSAPAATGRAAPAAAPCLRLSPALPLASWQALEDWRQRARQQAAEGLMLKDLRSSYGVGRRRGAWWKHKLEPLRLDAVLLYAQSGSGRRANLYTDYTFGLWETPPRAGASAAAPVPDVERKPAETGPIPTAHGPADTSRDASHSATDSGAMPRLVTFAKAYSGLADAEIAELDRWIRRHTTERFGPVRAVEPLQVFELAFEGIQPSSRHRSGLAVRFPRINRWRRDKPAEEADCLEAALALMAAAEPPPQPPVAEEAAPRQAGARSAQPPGKAPDSPR